MIDTSVQVIDRSREMIDEKDMGDEIKIDQQIDGTH